MFSEVTTRNSSSLSPVEREMGLPSVLSKGMVSLDGEAGISGEQERKAVEVESE